MTEKEKIKEHLIVAAINLDTAIAICNSDTIDIWEINTHLEIAIENLMQASGDLTTISLAAFLRKVTNET